MVGWMMVDPIVVMSMVYSTFPTTTRQLASINVNIMLLSLKVLIMLQPILLESYSTQALFICLSLINSLVLLICFLLMLALLSMQSHHLETLCWHVLTCHMSMKRSRWWAWQLIISFYKWSIIMLFWIWIDCHTMWRFTVTSDVFYSLL